ncbi:MAG: hypothetical protein K0S32_767 [Bacteroidetes bacterium]|jgi:hypothetical protein|nr:hypothetical protein [Bacteroidota bacterium]
MKKFLIVISACFIFSCQRAPEVKEIPEPTSTTSEPIDPSKKDSAITESENEIFDKTVNCKDLGGSMGEGYTRVCDFNRKTLREAYDYYLTTKSSDVKYLEKTLPVKDTIITLTDVMVTYKWETTSRISMLLGFAGGETTITFEEKKNKTVVTFYSSPD